MSNKVKDWDIKNIYKILIKDDIEIDEKSYKNILIYYVGYVRVKDLKYVKINSVNLLYLVFSNMNGYFEEINKSKYLTLVLTH